MNLQYKALPDHLGVLAANIGILDAFTTGDRSMRRVRRGTFCSQTPEWPRFSIETMEVQAEEIM